MINLRCIPLFVAAGIAIPVANAQVCTGNVQAATYLSRSAPAALYQAGQILMAPAGLQELLRNAALAQITSAVSWLESCPGALPVTLAPVSVCTYTTPSYFSQYVLLEWTTYQEEGIAFAEEPEAPLDTQRVNQTLSYLEQAYGLMAPCTSAGGRSRTPFGAPATAQGEN